MNIIFIILLFALHCFAEDSVVVNTPPVTTSTATTSTATTSTQPSSSIEEFRRSEGLLPQGATQSQSTESPWGYAIKLEIEPNNKELQTNTGEKKSDESQPSALKPENTQNEPLTQKANDAPQNSAIQDQLQTNNDTPSTISSVQNINPNYNPFQDKILACIGGDFLMLDIYKYQSVQQYIQKKFNIDTKCDRITQELTNAIEIQNKIHEISAIKECDFDTLDTSALTNEIAQTTLQNIQTPLKDVMPEYTKYFIYGEDIANIEVCIDFYSNLNIAHEIKTETTEILNSDRAKIESRREIIKEHGLLSFYGESKSALGIVPFITDVGNRILTVQQAKNYAVIELEPEMWHCSDTMRNLIIYTDGTHNIAIPMKKGIEYSCDKLPHDLFILQKKIENPKKEYSLFIFNLIE